MWQRGKYDLHEQCWHKRWDHAWSIQWRQWSYRQSGTACILFGFYLNILVSKVKCYVPFSYKKQLKRKYRQEFLKRMFLPAELERGTKALQFDMCCKATDQNFDCGCDHYAIVHLDTLPMDCNRMRRYLIEAQLNNCQWFQKYHAKYSTFIYKLLTASKDNTCQLLLHTLHFLPHQQCCFLYKVSVAVMGHCRSNTWKKHGLHFDHQHRYHLSWFVIVSDFNVSVEHQVNCRTTL